MNNQIAYSVLTYQHSASLGETLNLGVLFIFPESQKLVFNAPKSLGRISKLYPNFNERLIKSYLKNFEKTATTSGQRITQFLSDYKLLINHLFLVEDASSLQFSEIKVLFSNEKPEGLVEKITDKYLGYYSTDSSRQTKISDESLIHSIKARVFEINPVAKNLLGVDDGRILRSHLVSFKSDFYWKNGVTRYAKAVSFDLATPDAIIEKSILLNGKLRKIKKEIAHRAQIDFILNIPVHLNLQEATKEAEGILRDSEVKNEIFTDWRLYSTEIADNIKP